MSFFSERQLRGYDTYQFNESADRALRKSASLTRNTIFLSFSHKDEQLARGMKNYLSQLGMDLYIDVLDSDMTTHTDRDTALRIKSKIQELRYFFLLVTNNSVNSRWVPWELGIADGHKEYNKILVIPVADDYGQFKGNEYLQVYRRLVFADNGKPAVFNPSETSNGILVELFFGGY